MPKPAKIRTKEWLEQCLATDTKSRIIKVAEYLEVKCFTCETVGTVRAGNADHGIKKNGYAWSCGECRKDKLSKHASSRTGENNPFYGKSHSVETKEKLSVSATERQKKVPKSKRRAVSKIGYDAMVAKYNGNCMNDPDVIIKHTDAVTSEEFRERARASGLNIASKEGFSEKQRDFSKSYWDVNRESRTEDQRQRFLKNIENNPTWLEKRKRAFKEYISDPERVAATWVKTKKTCFEKYGAENWRLSKDADSRAKSFSSKAELEILSWVHSIGYPNAAKLRQGGKELDIFIPELNIGIEYNGLYWHSEIHKDKNYHLDKTNHFKELGVRVIHVFEHEWRDRNFQVKSFLRSALNKNDNKVGARKCTFKEIDNKTAKDFLNQYHIQGGPLHIALAIGSYYKDDLISVATFGPHHRNRGQFTLNRFAGKEGWTIQGCLSKVTKMALNKYDSLISWCDLRWSDGNGYERSGWVKEELLKPDYFYTQDFIGVISKQSRKKSAVNTPETMTEKDHALLDGLFRIYDCGKVRYKV